MGAQAEPWLIWTCLTRKQLELLRQHGTLDLLPREALAACIGLEASTSEQAEIELDLCTYTLRKAEEWGFDDGRTSTLFGIVRTVHKRAVEERLTVQDSFTHLKNLLLRHSVQRPPYSLGIFSLPELKLVTQWMIDTYFSNYKLYQYAFTSRITMSVSSSHPMDLAETAPELPPLAAADTQEQWQVKQDAAQLQREEDLKKEAEAAAVAEEAARQQRIDESFRASIPEDVQAKVAAALEKELPKLRLAMEEQFSKQETQLKAKISELESKLGVV